MEENREIALGKSFVPNRYEVYLNPEEFVHFAPYKASLEQEMSSYVTRYGQQRHFSFQSAPRVWLNQSADVRRRHINIRAYTVDPNQPAPTHNQNYIAQVEVNPEIGDDKMAERTSILNVGAQVLSGQQGGGAAMAVARPEATLVILDKAVNHTSRYIRFNKDITLGRGLDNDIVFDNDVRVSRHHARIDFKYGQFVLTDLNSTNGTSVNARPITQVVLSPRDRISLGGLDLMLQVD
jgi:hypothetical protein